jgi:hypothetical protein
MTIALGEAAGATAAHCAVLAQSGSWQSTSASPSLSIPSAQKAGPAQSSQADKVAVGLGVSVLVGVGVSVTVGVGVITSAQKHVEASQACPTGQSPVQLGAPQDPDRSEHKQEVPLRKQVPSEPQKLGPKMSSQLPQYGPGGVGVGVGVGSPGSSHMQVDALHVWPLGHGPLHVAGPQVPLRSEQVQEVPLGEHTPNEPQKLGPKMPSQLPQDCGAPARAPVGSTRTMAAASALTNRRSELCFLASPALCTTWGGGRGRLMVCPCPLSHDRLASVKGKNQDTHDSRTSQSPTETAFPYM